MSAIVESKRVIDALIVWGERRAVAASETVRHALGFAQRLGITRLADLTGLDSLGVPVVAAMRPASRSLAMSLGKGVSLDAARASALMECIELHHAEHIQAPVHLASLDELRRNAPDRVVDPLLLARVRHRHFDERQRTAWIDATGLRTGAPYLVPLQVVDLDGRRPRAYPSCGLSSDTNGLASGNTLDEAVVHGLCEVIERDAQSLWEIDRWDDIRSADTLIDLDSVDDPVCRGLIGRITVNGLRVGAWDTTSDLGVPCVVASIVDDAPQALSAVEGSGCHSRPEVALARALTEAAQARVAVIGGSRDDFRRREEFEDLADRAASEQLRAAMARTRRRRFDSIVAGPATRTTKAELTWLVDAVLCSGQPEPVAVDLTDPEIGVPVVKVIAPGLEPLPTRHLHRGSRGERRRRESESK